MSTSEPKSEAPLALAVAVDGSACSDAVLRWIADLHAAGVALRGVVVHAQQPVMSGEVGAVVPAEVAAAAHARAAAQVLERAGAALRAAGAGFGTEARVDDPAEAILAAARTHDCEVIVMGRRGVGAVRAALLGSASSAVVQRSRVPVIVVNSDVAARSGAAPRRLLLATDGSAPSARAAAFALRLTAAGVAQEIVLVHAQPGLTVAEAVLGPRVRLIEHWTGTEVERALAPARELLEWSGRTYRLHPVTGDAPGPAILQAARDLDCAMIVMGTRGLGPVAGLLLGSVAQHVLQHAHVPVALVH